MFPTLSSLINAVFGTDLSWPIPTFGFFVTLSFLLSYLIFYREFERKERVGQLRPFRVQTTVGIKMKGFLVLGYALLGFLVGFKGWGAYLAYDSFRHYPLRWLVSGQGSWVGGMLGAGLSTAIFAIVHRQLLWAAPREEHREIKPKDLLPTMLLWSGLTGFLGARIFAVFEDGQLLQTRGFWELLDSGGLTFWGGLLFGAATYFYLGVRRGLPWRHLADVGSLGMLMAYGVGRMGCHLSGDGDWGMVNTADKPFGWLPQWAWSFRFPHNVLNQGEYIPGCLGPYCSILPQGVFPTSLYESVLILFAFCVLWSIRKRLRRPGILFAIYLSVVGAERFLIEFIRVTYKFDVWGIALSEAQLISLGMLTFAAVAGVYLFIERKGAKRRTV